MLLFHSPAKVYNRFLESNLDETMLGLVMVRFYFLWRSNAIIASGVRQFAATLANAHLTKILLSITAPLHNSPVVTKPAYASLVDWCVDPSQTVEDHLVFAPEEIHSLYKNADTSLESFIQQLLYAEWVDKSFFIKFIESEDLQALFLGY